MLGPCTCREFFFLCGTNQSCKLKLCKLCNKTWKYFGWWRTCTRLQIPWKIIKWQLAITCNTSLHLLICLGLVLEFLNSWQKWNTNLDLGFRHYVRVSAIQFRTVTNAMIDQIQVDFRPYQQNSINYFIILEKAAKNIFY